MATMVEGTIGLDLTSVDFCRRHLLALLWSVLQFPYKVGELSGNAGLLFGVSVHSGYDTRGMLLAQQASSSVTHVALGQMWDRPLLSHLKENSYVSPFLAKSPVSLLHRLV